MPDAACCRTGASRKINASIHCVILPVAMGFFRRKACVLLVLHENWR
jgi:hypothetical protein